MQQVSDEWFRLRAGKITGTCFSVLMSKKVGGVSRPAMIRRLAEERITGVREAGFRSEAMIRGEEMEPEARRWYEFHTGNDVTQSAFITHPALPFVGVSPDGLVGEDGGVQIKCPLDEGHKKFVRLSRLPSQYRWQVQGELWVSGREWWDFVSYPDDGDGVILRVTPDHEMHRQLEAECIKANEEIEKIVKLLADKEALTDG